jgi:hypothetical protein
MCGIILQDVTPFNPVKFKIFSPKWENRFRLHGGRLSHASNQQGTRNIQSANGKNSRASLLL